MDAASFLEKKITGFSLTETNFWNIYSDVGGTTILAT